MKIRSVHSEPFKTRTEMLCGFVFEGENRVLGLSEIEKSGSHGIYQSIKDIDGKLGKIVVVPLSGKNQPQRLLITGLGNKKKMNNDTIRFASGKIAQKARELKLNEFTVICPPSSISKPEISISQIIEGCKLSLYKFEDFKSKKENKVPNLAIITPKSPKISKTVHIAETISDGVNYAKSLANLPPNECPPSKLAEIAKKLAAKNKLKCKVIQKNELKKKGFGGITAVGQGSKNEPRLIILEHKQGKSNEKPIVLVGKAVTFDTGGISLKPGEKMDEMKFDKCGGCNVFGIMKAISELMLPMNVIGIIPSVENMPGGESYRPGDIIKLYSGKTAEILNTDAEGRLILADAISYGEKHYSPKTIIDFATLTGACI
ncbi:MAG: M17 family peptidase N-terminal domain-containing protein, partial [Nitrosopumilaceae archaeon]|nr:M17 family peptidase N-terminal domain-containing protein [Nitrosopumilaceae archaeon]